MALFGYAIAAGAAQRLYYRAKYGDGREDPLRTLALCTAVRQYYAHHYYASLLAAQTAWAASQGDVTDAEAAALRTAAWVWCEQGLRQNPYLTGLWALRVQMLAQRAPAAAAREWEAYVNWHFWEPWNHALRVELYAAAGAWDEAWEAMRWVRGTPYEQHAEQVLREAWNREIQPPAGTR